MEKSVPCAGNPVKIATRRIGARRSSLSLPAEGKPIPLLAALHIKFWALIERPYSLGSATVGALYERPRSIFCAKPLLAEEGWREAPFSPVRGSTCSVRPSISCTLRLRSLKESFPSNRCPEESTEAEACLAESTAWYRSWDRRA